MSKSQPSRGLFPLLKSSHSVAPKLHLSHFRVRLSGDASNSGATQGILSTITKNKATSVCLSFAFSAGHEPSRSAGQVSLTVFSQHHHADSRVAQLDEGWNTLGWVTFSGQQQVFGADVSMNDVILLLRGGGTKKYPSTLYLYYGGGGRNGTASSLPENSALM